MYAMLCGVVIVRALDSQSISRSVSRSINIVLLQS